VKDLNTNGATDTTDTNTLTIPPARPTLTFDAGLYDDCLNDPDLDADERRQILEALWTIICCFIDLGYDVQPEKSCGQPPNPADHGPLQPIDVLDSPQTHTPKNFAAAATLAQRKGEES